MISEPANASKSSTGSSTRQGKCFKKCTNCSTMARSNRQKHCRLCGPETMWSARVRRSVRRARNRPVSLFTNLQAQTRRIQHTGPVKYKDQYMCEQKCASSRIENRKIIRKQKKLFIILI